VRFKVSIREGWKNRETGRIGPPRIKFLNFELLSDTIKNNSKKLIIHSDLKSVDENSINKVKNILNRYKGNKPVGFNVYYPEEEIKISMKSRNQKVDVCNELLDELDSISVKYHIR
jgi:DNA polymerase-3 subunit alpha